MNNPIFIEKTAIIKAVKSIFLVIVFALSSTLNAQIAINTDGSSPDGSAMLEVKSSNKGFLPPRMTYQERDDLQNPTAGLMIYNTTTNKPNYFNGTEWMNFDGTSTEPAVGDYYQGGVIFYVDGNGGGLICAIEDQDGGGVQWYNGSYTNTGATGITIGTGQANTTAIISNQGSGNYAAAVCDNYTVGTYSDWFLPSKDELNEIYEHKAAIDATATANGGNSLTTGHYWSSSEENLNDAWYVQFFGGAWDPLDKGYDNRVRAVRAF